MQRFEIVLVTQVQTRDVRNREPIHIFAYDLDRIAGSDVALFLHGEVETGAAALKKTFDDVVAPKLHRELVAREPRLRDHQLSRTNSKLVTDVDFPLEYSFDG